MPPTDRLPSLVASFVAEPHGPSAAPLLAEVSRHVRAVSRPYPDAYFALGQKQDDAIEDLGNRVFAVCASVTKGRFPFSGRQPFHAYAEERMEGRAVRYHSFYAKISVTREIMRDDYARNIVRDPVLRWRAELYKQVGVALRQCASQETRGRGLPPAWAIPAKGPRLIRPPEDVAGALHRALPADTATLVRIALELGGPTTQSRLTNLLETVLDPPATTEAAGPDPQSDLPTRLTVRAAVLAAWQELEEADQHLLVAIARGDGYDELIARDPRLKHRVAVTRAVKRCGQAFVQHVLLDLGLMDLGMDTDIQAPPRQLVEAVMEVLAEILPDPEAADAGGHR